MESHLISAEEFDALVELAALGMLGSDEQTAVDQFVAMHLDAQAKLDSAMSDLAHLALLAPGVTPPARLGARIMHQVRTESSFDRPNVSWWRRLFPTPLTGAVGAASFASLAFVVTLSWALNMQTQLHTRVQELASAKPSIQAVDSDYGTVHPVSMRRLAGSANAPSARGWLYMDPTNANALLVTYQLPPLPAGMGYQLWLVNPANNLRVSGGVFEVDPEGYGWLRVASPQAMSSFQRVGITVEPMKGSPGPTGMGVLGGDI